MAHCVVTLSLESHLRHPPYHDDDECYIVTGWANKWSMIRTQREYILQFDSDDRLVSVYMNTVFLGEEDGEYLTYP